MKGTIELADILKQRDAEKYKAIITRAANNGYHDHKFMSIPGHPEYAACLCPKVQLVTDLSVFPELDDIKKDVMEGKYDEVADEQDAAEMRGWLIEDGAPDSLFKEFGFKVPTEAERLLRKPINN
ncbi:MAG TPA: hypothetical protein VGK59_23795 [Ohtaekwangia sp.]